MAFLQNMTVLPSTSHGTTSGKPRSKQLAGGQHGEGRPLRSTSSIAALLQLARNPVEVVGDAVEGWRDGLTKEGRAERQSGEDKKRLLYLKMRNATKFEEWQASATELDEFEGNNAWKSVFESPDYDAELVEARLKQLDEARISCDVGRMLFLVRTAFTRGLGDMGNLKLYKHTHLGTKDLIERYISSALETLDALLDISARAKCDGHESKYILEQVLSARQSFGRSALLLSGGATFGMNHIGVLKALWEERLLPRIISGASAGSIVCAVLCTRTDEEMPEVLANFCHGDLAVFEEEGNEDGVLRKVARFLKFGALFDISHLTRVMKDLLGDMTFQEAYNRTRRILNICVSSASLYELPRLLNYVTAPNVIIWSAVAASCSVPFIFSAASLLAKDPKTGEAVPWNPSPQRWIDGSVDNDIPMTRLAEMFNVNHFIVSQVNPHVVPFLIKEEESLAQEAQQSSSTVASGPSWLTGFTHLAKAEALHRMHILAEMGIFPNTLTKAVSVLSQKYSGDITIFPEISYADFPRMLSNPTPEFMMQAMLHGEQATWPKLSRIKNHCAIELALDEAVQNLRARVVFSPSQADLRLTAHSQSTCEARKVASRGRGKGNRHRRSMSQISDTAAMEIKAGKLGRPTGVAHEKSRSNDTFLPQSKQQYLSRTSTAAIPPATSNSEIIPPKPQHDIISSEAETSHNTTSDSDIDASSTSIDSPSPPSSPPLPTLWPTTRQLFPFASQPVTPARYSSISPVLPLSSPPNASSTTTLKPNTSPSASVKSLSMTPTATAPLPNPTTPSSPEQRYKRLFHNNSTSRSAAKPPRPKELGTVTTPQKTGVKRVNALGFEIDISGTRGMVMRKKRSEQ